MKEAAGEANMTVVTIIIIGVIVVIATPIITSVIENTEKRSCCISDGVSYNNNGCSNEKTYVKGCPKAN